MGVGPLPFLHHGPDGRKQLRRSHQCVRTRQQVEHGAGVAAAVLRLGSLGTRVPGDDAWGIVEMDH